MCHSSTTNTVLQTKVAATVSTVHVYTCTWTYVHVYADMTLCTCMGIYKQCTCTCIYVHQPTATRVASNLGLLPPPYVIAHVHAERKPPTHLIVGTRNCVQRREKAWIQGYRRACLLYVCKCRHTNVVRHSLYKRKGVALLRMCTIVYLFLLLQSAAHVPAADAAGT